MMNAAENKGVDTTVATDSDTNTNLTTPTTDNNNTPSSNNTNNNDNNSLITNPINEGEDVKWIFVSATSGSVAKQFQFKSDDGTTHKVVLKHHTVTGELDILLDGKELLSEVTDLTVGNWSEKFYENFPTFTVQGQSGVVKWCVGRGGWGPVPSTFGYACIINGKSVQDDMSVRASSEKGQDLKIWIPSAEITGSGVVWYRIDTKVKSTGMEVAVHRRFSDFHFLFTSIAVYFKGSHLYNALPPPPPKGLKLFQDQTDPDFIETRRQQLENFLRRLVVVPRVAELQEVYDVLGIIDSKVRETSMIFGPGSLGLTLRSQKDGGASEAIVADFKPGKDGTYGPAKQSGLIDIGDCVSKIDGESVFESGYDAIVYKLKTSDRPVLVHFLGYAPAGKQAYNTDDGENTAE